MICLAHQSILSLASVRVQDCKHIILHESEPLFVVVLAEHTGALMLHYLLEAHHKDVRQISRWLPAVDSWQEPVPQVDLSVRFDPAYVPGAHSQLDLVKC